MDWLVTGIGIAGVIICIIIVVSTFAPKGWRTVWANILVVAASLITPEVFELLIGAPWKEIVDPQTAILVPLGLSVMNIYLRKITTTPMGVE